MKLLLRSCASILLGAALLYPAPARAAEPSAADRETARALVIEGRQKLGNGDHEGARKAFQAAHELMGVPTTGLDLARALEKLGKLVEARTIALEVTNLPPKPREPAAFTEARPAAAALAEQLEARIPALELRIAGPPEGAAVLVRVDGEVVPPAALSFPRKVNPGEHTVEASVKGFSSERRAVSVPEGKTVPVEIRLAPLAAAETETATPKHTLAPAPAPPDSGDSGGGGGAPVWAWAAGGAGIVAIGIGAYFAVDHFSVRGEVEERCPGGACDPSVYSRAEVDALRARWNRDVVLAVGLGAAGLAGVGVAIWGFTSGSSKKEGDDAAMFLPWAARGAFGADYRGVF